MQKIKLLAGVLVLIVPLLLLSSGCVEMGAIPIGAPVDMAAVEADIDYNAVYQEFEGGPFYYWVWDPVGFWVFTQTAFLPPAYFGRTIYRGHYPGHWGHPGSRHGGRGFGHSGHGGMHRGHDGMRGPGGGVHRPSGGVHRPSGGVHRPSGGVHRPSGGGGHHKR